MAPLLPILGEQFGIEPREAAWLITAYLISAAVATPIGGKLGDLYGRPRVLRLVMVVLTVGGVMALLAPSFVWLLAARFVQGLGGCIFPLAFGVIRDQFPADRVPGAIGLTSSIVALGAGAGIVVVGPLEAAFGYRSVLALPVALALVGTVLAYVVIPDTSTTNPEGRVGWWSAAFLSAALTAFLVAVTEMPVWGATWPTFATVLACLVSTAAWVVAERRSASPLIDLDLLTRPALIAVNLLSFLGGWYLFAVLTLMPQFLQLSATSGGLGTTIAGSSLLLAPQTVMVFLAGLGAGFLNRVIGGRRSMIAASTGMIMASALLVFFHSEPWQVLIAGTLSGLAIGALFAVVPNIVVSQVDQHRTGIATGVNLTARNVGGAVGAQVTAAVPAVAFVAGSPVGFVGSFASLALVGVLSLGAALFLPRPVR